MKKSGKQERNEDRSRKKVQVVWVMRNDFVLDQVYLGSVGTAFNLQVLREFRISDILTVSEDLKPRFLSEFTYKVLPIPPECTSQISQYFDPAADFIQSSLSNHGTILVHCLLGVSRSPSILIAYLIKYHKMKFSSAYGLIKKKKPSIDISPEFQKQLKKYSNQLNFHIN